MLATAGGHFTSTGAPTLRAIAVLAARRCGKLNAEAVMDRCDVKWKEHDGLVGESKRCRHFGLNTYHPASTSRSFRTDTRERPHRCGHPRHRDASFRAQCFLLTSSRQCLSEE